MGLPTLLLFFLASVDIAKGSTLTFCKKNYNTSHMNETDYSGYQKTGRATVICNDGYMAEPNSTTFCLVTDWSDVTCTPIDCQDITPPANGNVIYLNGSTKYKAVAAFDCNEGFVLNKNAKQTCTANGSWVGYTPECNIIDCLKLNLTNGNVTYANDSTAYKGVALFSCNEGFYLAGHKTSKCTSNNTWSEPLPKCTEKDCGPLDAPNNGTIVYVTNETTYQAEALFFCDEDYKLNGDAKLTCMSNGEWNGTTPVCIFQVSDSESEERGSDVVIILVVLVAIIVFACAALVIYLRKSGKVCLTKKVGDSEFDQLDIEIKVFTKFRPSAIRRSDFPSYVAVLHKEGNKLFADGFRLLNEESPIHPTTVAESKACKPKTRFANILPFDGTRVKLTPIEGEEGSDFINASFIPGFSSPKEYIATQGPLSETKNDFWRMIWEYNVDLIVMLTQRLETGKGSLPRNYKAERHWVVAPVDQYWPDEVQGPVYYGKFIVQTKSESVLSDYVTRVMEIILEGEMRTITQIHYLRWPEHGCPRRYWPFINFVTMVRQYMPRQLVVHCSTGVGRTGTFLAVDRLLQHIKANDTVDPYHIILEMRNCRSSMVKTLEQFMYVYECICHFITLEEDIEDEEDDERQYAHVGNGQNPLDNPAFDKASMPTRAADRGSTITTLLKKNELASLLKTNELYLPLENSE